MKPPLLYSVLNWGLGHATRSVPVIRQLILMGYDVHLASSGDARTYLSELFPTLNMLTLPDYKVRYLTSSMTMNALIFAPSMMKAIRAEHRLVREYGEKHLIGHAFSDNRYGCYLPHGKNYFIGHQLNIKTADKVSDAIVNFVQRWFLRDFQYLLVPDFRQMPNLAGNLSRTEKAEMKENTTYLGPLSSYRIPENKPIKYKWCCILSGIEPQRTYLAQKIYNILEQRQIPSVIISGKRYPVISSGESVKVFPLLQNEEVQNLVEESESLCMRSGYTSIMDLTLWRKPALLIPTPGQPEQIYLAEYLRKTYAISTVLQENLSTKMFLEKPQSTEVLPHYDEGMLHKQLRDLLGTVKL